MMAAPAVWRAPAPSEVEVGFPFSSVRVDWAASSEIVELPTVVWKVVLSLVTVETIAEVLRIRG